MSLIKNGGGVHGGHAMAGQQSLLGGVGASRSIHLTRE